ncbi:Uncharacterised protein [Mycobacteroides abscessus subsp. abscessus]|uniref:hypothetical protein n=1 Tax=Mycobacteroides abscessus TaxID=36809 RepID=UPI000926F531|nr:hypothetical protein [Mycobacteroides abscessus]SIJ21126.1 Uncharacterised protein [Mycobacteroides abscessus subsp. abscessus]SLH39324.1 Uncharacterised protein [Mycobacteroides abscessus subsp. abscessus]
MTNLPDKIETTAEFCYTLRRLREQLIGLPLDRIAPPDMRYPEHLADVETPGLAIPNGLIYQYDHGLRWYLGQQWEDLAAALATAHFVNTEDTHLAAEVARWQIKNTGAPLVLLLGAEVGSSVEYIAARSISPVPAAENLYTERDSDRWLRAGATLAWRRNGLTFVRAQDQDLEPIKSLFQRWDKDDDRKHVYFAGTTGHPGYYTTLAVDPVKAITSLKSAGRIAEAMGAGPDERAALAWGLLLTNRASGNHPEHKKPHTGIENWPALDAAGPAAYQELLDGITDFLAPAPDLIWSTTRRYLARWHGYYAHAALDVVLDTETGETKKRPWLHAEPLNLDVAHRYLIAYDEQVLPGLPAVMTEITPSVTITPTRMWIEPGENDTTGPDDYWWLPSGIDGRILARKSTGTWKAIQLAAGTF